MKEFRGIVIGIALFIVLPVLLLVFSSKSESKYRTTPVFAKELETCTFEDEKTEEIAKALQAEDFVFFLYLTTPQRPVYSPYFIGKMKASAEILKNVFPESRTVAKGREIRIASALKQLGGGKEPLMKGMTTSGKITVYYSGDFLIISFPMEVTPAYLNKDNMENMMKKFLNK